MISVSSEKIFKIGDFAVTNTLLTSWLVILMITLLTSLFYKNLAKKPNKLQTLIEFFFENIYNFLKSILGENFNIKIFAFIISFFVFILFSNWLGLLPGIGSIYLREADHKVSLLRSTYSDLNMTLALAIISVIGTNLLGILNLGRRFIKKFLGPVGFLEIIGEFAKILSFSFRLFGNIFAGEVLLTVIGGLLAFIAPIPFLGLEIFVGFIQALIFTVLTTIFIKVALETH